MTDCATNELEQGHESEAARLLNVAIQNTPGTMHIALADLTCRYGSIGYFVGQYNDIYLERLKESLHHYETFKVVLFGKELRLAYLYCHAHMIAHYLNEGHLSEAIAHSEPIKTYFVAWTPVNRDDLAKIIFVRAANFAVDASIGLYKEHDLKITNSLVDRYLKMYGFDFQIHYIHKLVILYSIDAGWLMLKEIWAVEDRRLANPNIKSTILVYKILVDTAVGNFNVCRADALLLERIVPTITTQKARINVLLVLCDYFHGDNAHSDVCSGMLAKEMIPF